MANVINKSTNKFTKGLVLDFSPENTKNEVLTHALNATLLTFNGNEMSLQNDMGNARVETAFLPNGYIPVGTCEYGGIIYIVSYNPIEDKSQIGCFPSPERNISSKELGISDVIISKDSFQETITEKGLTGKITNNAQYVLLKNDNLNPGDKFIITSEKNIYNERLANLLIKKDGETEFDFVKHPILKLSVVSIEESGKIVYLNTDNTLRQYEVDNNYVINGEHKKDTYKYHILGKMIRNNQTNELAPVTQEDLDSYRNVLSSGYNVFKSKTSGKLAILAELIMIDTYSVTHSIEQVDPGKYDIIIHTEVDPQITEENYDIVPKLRYYYLEESQGYISSMGESIPLFKDQSINDDFLNTPIKNIIEIDSDDSETLNTGSYNFPEPKTYHGYKLENIIDPDENGSFANASYTRFIESKYHLVKKRQIDYDYFKNTLNVKLYQYIINNEEYTEVDKSEPINNSLTYYVEETTNKYINAKRDSTYQSQTLYKIDSQPVEVTSTDIENTLVEKFQYVTVITYRKATDEEIDNKEGTFYIYDSVGNKYTSITGNPDKNSGITYYKEERTETLVSVGYELVPEEYENVILYYYPEDSKNYVEATEEELKNYWDKEAYPLTGTEPYGYPLTLYYIKEITEKRLATDEELEMIETSDLIFYTKTDYALIQNSNDWNNLNDDSDLFVVVNSDIYLSLEHFIPNTKYNFIEGYANPAENLNYPKNDELKLYFISDFIPNNEGDLNSFNYDSVKLASITIPEKFVDTNTSFPFIYNYKITPCMNYGRLDHLAISNTIKFEHLNDFNKSNFNTWKYYIENDKIRLTFGCEIYDTLSDKKVKGILLEFYDLWGFAGSLEITGKKSYSGIFTKNLYFNSINTLSNKRVYDNDLISTPFSRNIGIIEENNKFYFNEKEITFDSDSARGWIYSDSKLIENSDCGMLYPNLIYGVKAYFICEEASTINYVEKDKFILFTLPLYNNFYHSIQNFKVLINPKLDLTLTYKLTDKSNSVPYTFGSIINGYDSNSEQIVNDYYNNNIEEDTSFEKYYSINGITNVNLEIGLSEKYKNYNLNYDPQINNCVKCNLELLTDTVENAYQINIGFNETYDSEKTIEDGFQNYNFLNNLTKNTIKIHYEFIVKYLIDIINISSVSIPVTTVCALFHQNEIGNYNYSDFNLKECTYLNSPSNSTSPEYATKPLSNLIFYNSGSHEQSIFGICNNIDAYSNELGNQCLILNEYTSVANEITREGKLNTGQPLQQFISQIGKLSFIQPHTHTIPGNTKYGVNIQGDTGERPDFVISYNLKGSLDDWFQGTWPMTHVNNWPRYNMVLNTKGMIDYQNEFISTIDCSYKPKPTFFDCKNGLNWYGEKINQRIYTGFSADQLASFYIKMLETLKSVYVVNPDYNSILQNVGTVSIKNPDSKISIYLINKSFELDYNYVEQNKFNDFIYLGNISITNYISKLETYMEPLDESLLNNVEFTYNDQYCGTSNNPYLISSLTYNIPADKNIINDLTLNSSDLIIVKHHDGTKSILKGNIYPNLLYGFDTNSQKLIQLDVSNYEIDFDGKLSIIKRQYDEEYTHYFLDSFVNILPDKIFGTPIKFNPVTDLKPDQLTYTVSVINQNGVGINPCKVLYENNDIYIIKPKTFEQSILKFNLTLDIENNDNYEYELLPTEIELQCNGILLDNELFDTSSNLGSGTKEDVTSPWDPNTTCKPPNIFGVTVEQCKYLLSEIEPNSSLNINETSCLQLDRDPSLFQKPLVKNTEDLTDEKSEKIFINGKLIQINTFNNYIAPINFNMNVYNFMQTIDNIDNISKLTTITANEGLELYHFTIKKIKYNIIKTESFEKNPDNIILTNQTKNYGQITDHKYEVLSIYQNAQLRGTSLTLNDLYYEPNIDSHRLYIRNGIYRYDAFLRNKLYYRTMIDDETSDNCNSKEDYEKLGITYEQTKNLNTLFLYTGPCFTENNL